MRKTFLYILLIITTVASVYAQRGRVQIQDGTVVTDKGTLLRGALDRNYFIDFDWEDHHHDIQTIKDYGLNCIHMYMEEPNDAFPEGNRAYYDSIVNWTREDSLYLLMTPSWKNGDDKYDIEFIREFWKYYANRYKDETHLIFEIANEPQLFNAPYDSLTLEMHRSVYDTIRKYAPETHIMFMSYAFNINADSALMDIKSLGDGIDWSNASISAHGYIYSAETTREFIHAIQDSGYAVIITECPSVGNGWTERLLNKSFLRIFEEEFISSLHHITLKQILEFPDGFISQIERSNIRWQPDFGTWPINLTGIEYINPYQPIQSGFNDEGAKISRFVDSVYMYGIEDGAYVAYYNLDFDNNTDTFSIACSAAAENWGSVEIHLDSLNGSLAGTCQLPQTSGWYDTKTYFCPVTIQEGIHDIYLVFHSDNWHVAGIFKSILFVRSGVNSKQPPYNGLAFNLPGKIEAEEYDNGGKNISYFDSSQGNTGNYFRYDNVDIEQCADTNQGYDVGYIEEGEWLEYTINCDNACNMDIQLRIASTESGEKIRLKLDDQILGTVTLPNTAGWQNWETVKLEDITIPAGENQILRLEFLDSGFNLNWLNFVATEVTGFNKVTSQKQITIYPNPAWNKIIVNTNEKVFLEIYSMCGQLIKQKNISANEDTIAIDDLSPGSYIINIKSDSQIYTEMLIIE